MKTHGTRTLIRLLTIAVIFLIALAIAIYFTGKQIPTLTSPIMVEDIAMFSDGGSMRVVVKDNDGQLFLFGLKGSLTIPQMEFPVYVQRWHPWIPFPIMLRQRGEDERALINALNEWIKDLPPASNEAAVFSKIRSTLIQRNEKPVRRDN